MLACAIWGTQGSPTAQTVIGVDQVRFLRFKDSSFLRTFFLAHAWFDPAAQLRGSSNCDWRSRLLAAVRCDLLSFASLVPVLGVVKMLLVN